jgi:hypothetical protein
MFVRLLQFCCFCTESDYIVALTTRNVQKPHVITSNVLFVFMCFRRRMSAIQQLWQ